MPCTRVRQRLDCESPHCTPPCQGAIGCRLGRLGLGLGTSPSCTRGVARCVVHSRRPAPGIATALVQESDKSTFCPRRCPSPSLHRSLTRHHSLFCASLARRRAHRRLHKARPECQASAQRAFLARPPPRPTCLPWSPPPYGPGWTSIHSFSGTRGQCCPPRSLLNSRSHIELQSARRPCLLRFYLSRRALLPSCCRCRPELSRYACIVAHSHHTPALFSQSHAIAYRTLFRPSILSVRPGAGLLLVLFCSC